MKPVEEWDPDEIRGDGIIERRGQRNEAWRDQQQVFHRSPQERSAFQRLSFLTAGGAAKLSCSLLANYRGQVECADKPMAAQALRGLLIDQPGDPTERELIALGPEAGDDAVCAGRDERVMPKGLALMDV